MGAKADAEFSDVGVQWTNNLWICEFVVNPLPANHDNYCRFSIGFINRLNRSSCERNVGV